VHGAQRPAEPALALLYDTALQHSQDVSSELPSAPSVLKDVTTPVSP
jgi:hypothetical protein